MPQHIGNGEVRTARTSPAHLLSHHPSRWTNGFDDLPDYRSVLTS
jgi:hypothetical protein